MTESSVKTPYQLMGEEPAILNLVDRFYFYMDSMQEVEVLRKMHAKELTHVKEKLFKFLSGWLGGPDLFIQEYGHPMLRRRHFPFKIGDSERDQWMVCMKKAMAEVPMDTQLRASLLESFDQLATHMINR